MFNLFLPILFPSWRFFSGIGPSPRFDIGFLRQGETDPENWIDINQLPEHLNFWGGLGRLFHNPVWNDQLYINTCAEHLFEFNSDFREQEIADRLLHLFYIKRKNIPDDVVYFCFRIRTIESADLQPQEKVVFFSRAFVLEKERSS